jgi:hypothetical protein
MESEVEDMLGRSGAQLTHCREDGWCRP